ncbi:hypothetical protein GCM10012278_66610 [Nonomuraea glycinis]|uniref:Uncharacterized protein n=1 Tax=Nonomuraea glycinis TaxID=2047744 RepID=A0A918E9L9_9ACTN|nr:hypothetical protein GCM10012278_66610 [Nonomuraea glycinis]
MLTSHQEQFVATEGANGPQPHAILTLSGHHADDIRPDILNRIKVRYDREFSRPLRHLFLIAGSPRHTHCEHK